MRPINGMASSGMAWSSRRIMAAIRIVLLQAIMLSCGTGFAQLSDATLTELREMVRKMIKTHPEMFYMPVFKETDTELEYFLGGFARDSLGAARGVEGPASLPSDTLAVIELIRSGAERTEAGKVFWTPVLDGAEKMVAEELALLSTGRALEGETAAKLRQLDEKARATLADAMATIARSRGKNARAIENPHVRTEEVTVPKYRSEVVTEYVPVIREMSNPDGTKQYITEQVPVTRHVYVNFLELMTRVFGPRLYQVTVAAVPARAEAFYLNQYDYDFLEIINRQRGQVFDAYANWKKAPWSQIIGKSDLRGVYYFRAYWPDGRKEYRSGVIPVTHDITINVSPRTN